MKPHISKRTLIRIKYGFQIALLLLMLATGHVGYAQQSIPAAHSCSYAGMPVIIIAEEAKSYTISQLTYDGKCRI